MSHRQVAEAQLPLSDNVYRLTVRMSLKNSFVPAIFDEICLYSSFHGITRTGSPIAFY